MSRSPSPHQERQLRGWIARYEERERKYPAYNALWFYAGKLTTVTSVRAKLARKYEHGCPKEESEEATDASLSRVDDKLAAVTALAGEMELLIKSIQKSLNVRADRSQ